MRLNKKKLAALAMSAVMAASTMPFSVLAEEFTDMGEATVATERGVGDVVGTKVEFNADDKTAVFTYPNGTKSQPVAAFQAVVTELTCTQNETKEWRATDPASNVTYSLTAPEITRTAVGAHTWGEDYWLTTDAAKCGHDGTQTKYHKCTVCSTEEAVKDASGKPITRTITAPAHTFGSTYTKVTNSYNLDSNLQLVNKDTDGWYELTTYHKCSACSAEEAVGSAVRYNVLSDATATIHHYEVELRDGNNISTTFAASYNKVSDIPADSAIYLTKCTENGEYWIVAKNATGSVVYTEKHIVPAHHVTSLEIQAPVNPLLKVVTENGVQRVKNLSCSKSVDYTEVVKCAAEGNKVISTEKKTALPEGTHTNNYMVASRNWLKNNAVDGYVTKAQYESIVSNATDRNYKVTVTGDCSEEVSITITYLCDECKEPLPDSVTVKCKELLHVWGKAEIANKVEPTCSKEGSYDTVQTCTICGKEENVRTGVVIPATGMHSFKDEKTGAIDYTDAYIKFTGTKVVDKNGANVTRKGQSYDASNALYYVTVASVIECETCGEAIAVDPAATVTVVDVKKETEEEAGSITLKATWYTPDKKIKLEDTYTVPYYSSIAAYLDRDPEKDPINGLHKDEDGVWRYYENNEVTDFTGIAEYQGGKFFVANGVLCSDAKGLNLYNGEWYFLAGGQIQTQVTGLAMYNGEWFFLTNGKLDRSKTGLVEYDGAKFIIAKGELQRYSGLWQDPADGTWYFAALGQIQEQYTGTAIYDGQTFELVNGKLVR